MPVKKLSKKTKLVMYYIEVDNSGANAKVILIPPVGRLKKNEHAVCFASNDARTVIRHDKTSPFTEDEVGPGTILDIGNGGAKGPYVAVNVGKHHFDCGFRNPEAPLGMSAWGGGGADPPVDL